MPEPHRPLHVSLVATPETQVSPLSGIFETLGSFGLLAALEPDVPARPFDVDIVAADAGPVRGASGLPLGANRSFREIDRTDIVIVPLMMIDGLEWERGRYPDLVDWLRGMHRQGAVMCSACTGVLLLAETGLLRGHDATLHWAFADTFRRNYPDVRLRTEEVLITAGDREELVMTGGVTSWHDLVLHLITRRVGPTAAAGMARLMMLQWHTEGQAPYLTFAPRTDHGDAVVRRVQEWLAGHYAVPNPVSAMVEHSGIPRRSLERRFLRATGWTPLSYVHRVRTEEAKRLLERTDTAVEQIGRAVGYENASFFRRVFRRTTRLTPSGYRQRIASPGRSELTTD